jgi:hypothetical protein
MAFLTMPEIVPWYPGEAITSPWQRRTSPISRSAAGGRPGIAGSYIGNCNSAPLISAVSAPAAAADSRATSRARSVEEPCRVVPPIPRMKGRFCAAMKNVLLARTASG